jgi:16S rRNA U1498 N3-methylase RsmE
MKVFLTGRSLADGQPFEITGDDYRYLVVVRRHSVGDRIPARGGDGSSGDLLLRSVDRDAGTAVLEPVGASGNRQPATHPAQTIR